MFKPYASRLIELIVLCPWLISMTGRPIYSQTVKYGYEEVSIPVELEGFYGYSMIQDSDGFIWFGSNLGLHRYDGATFKTYVVRDTKWPSFAPKTCTHFIEDNGGLLWFTTEYFLASFNRKTESFHLYTDTLLSAPVYMIAQGNDGYIWMGSESGLSRFDRRTGTFRHYPTYDVDHPDTGKIPVYMPYEDREGRLWLVYLSGSLGIFERGKESFRIIENLPGFVKYIFEDHHGRHWLATTSGVFRFYPETGRCHQVLDWPDLTVRLRQRFHISIIHDRSEGFWINSTKGIRHYNERFEETGSWNFFNSNLTTLQDSITYMPRYPCADNEGNVWFFVDNRIGKIIQHQNFFNTYLPGKSPGEKRVSSDPDRTTYISNTFAVNSGLYELDRDNHLARRLNVEADHEIEVYCFSIIDRNGNTWFTTEGSGLFKGSREEDGAVHFENVFSDPRDSTHVPGLYIYHLFEDSQGRIWLEVKGHLPCYYDPEKDRIFRVVNNPESRDSLPDENALGYSRGTIQGETVSGILLGSNRSTGIFAMVPPLIRVSEHTVMPSDVIRFRPESGEGLIKGWEMHQSARDTSIIWCRGTAREGGGFHRITLLHPGANDFVVTEKVISFNNELSNPHVSGFREDRHGNFWLATNAGLYFYDPFKETYICFTEKDGLPDRAFASNHSQSADGEMFFCTVNGHFVSFCPDSIHFNSRIPPVYITDVSINQKLISPRENESQDSAITYAPHLKLTYKQNNVSISYAALNYTALEQNQYKYRLEGFSPEWIYAGNRTQAEYNNLKPGRYTFRVAGSNNTGIWNEQGASLDFVIASPPWKTIWAYLLYGLILAGLFMWNRRYIINREKMRNALALERFEKEKIQEFEQLKSRFFANISHEFRTPLTLLLGPLEDSLKKKKKNGKTEWGRDLVAMMHRNASQLQHLINQLLDITKLESGKMELGVSGGNLTETVNLIASSFLSLAERKQIQYSYQVPDNTREVFFDQDKIEKILTNLLSNAFKFTPDGGRIRVSLQLEPYTADSGPAFAKLMVSDTGKGIPADQLERIFERFYQVSDSDTRRFEGSGIGLALTRDLVKLCHGDIRVESTPGKGTTFLVRLPVSKDQFSDQEIAEDKATHLDKKGTESEIGNHKIPEPPGPAPESRNRKPRETPVILIVEDNWDMKNYISSRLSEKFRILTAEDGKSGLEMAVKNIPDLVISDVMMPVMDGVELCRRLKTDERTNHLPVVLLTAKADRSSKMAGLETGADDYITKPFDAEELYVRVWNLIDQRKKLKANFRKEYIASSVAPKAKIQDRFLTRLVCKLEENISNPEFNMEELGNELHMSRAQLYRKVDAVAGVSPHELLRMVRMKRAAQLLKSGDLNIAQVMYQVGMRNTSYFARAFHHYFGTNPSEYGNTEE